MSAAAAARRGLRATAVVFVSFSSSALAGTAGAPALRVLAVAHDVGTASFDDPVWAEAPITSGLMQQEPAEGFSATLRTECRALATPHALFVRFTMEQPPVELVARELRRDADLSSDDRIAFVLDTYRDRRNGYYFATNPNGVRVDGLVSDEQTPSLDWDTVWDVRVRRTPTGWEALFRIPFAALSFPGERDGTWGFNFGRDLKRRTEIDRWAGWRRPFGLSKVSLAGELTGLPAMPARRLHELTPYALGSVDDRANPSRTSLLGKAGLDFREGISSSVEADLTANTDFAETEVDLQQFNFGRTSLFFPEKRPFFLQRSQIFAFGSSATTLPFFSRTIGLSAEDPPVPIPIDAGLKLTGHLGPTEFGALGVQAREAAGQPRTDFFAGRVKEDLGHASYVGALFTDVARAEASPLGRGSRTWGADTGLTITPELNLNGFWAKTETPEREGRTDAWNAELTYQSPYVNAELRRTNIGGAFNPEMGFVSQAGIHQTLADFEVTPRPHVLGLKTLDFEGFTAHTYNEDGSLREREYQYTFRAYWQNGAYSDNDIVDVFDEVLTEPLQLTDRVSIPPGTYHFARHQIAFGTNPSRPLAFQANVNFGDYYGGTRNRFTGRVFLKPSAHVGVSVIENYNVVRLPQGNFDLSLLSMRLDWNPSIRLLSSVILQSDNVDRLTNVQVVVRWLVDPSTDIFAVGSRQSGAGFERPGTRISMKIRRSFDL